MTETMRICETCEKPIPRDPGWKRSYYATRRFCNRECQAAARPSITCDYTVRDDGCWEWKGHIDRNGYGRAYDPTLPVGQRTDWAHRVSYRHHRGEIPAGRELDHTCQNTRCVNPDHLDPVTRAEHAARTVRRRGKDDLHAHAAKLRQSGLTYSEIAEALELADRGSAANAVRTAIRKGLVDPASLPQRRQPVELADHADIRALYALGIPQTEIAAWYGVHSSHVSRICSRGHGTKVPSLEAAS